MDDWRVWVGVAVMAIGVIAFLQLLDKQAEREYDDRKDRRANATARAVAAYATVNRPQLPAVTHYSPHQQYQITGQTPERALAAPPDPVVSEAPALPGVTDLGTLLAHGWRPSAEAILLGLGPGGVPLTVPAGDLLCHVAFGGKTGAGKTNLMRLFLTQLCAAGAEVYLCDPHYAPINPRTREDWRPIAARLQGGGPVVDKAAIVALVDGLGAELDRRLTRWHAGVDPGPVRFYAIEELPLLAAHDKDFMGKLGRLLREGRKLGLYVIVAAQDLLVSTLGGSSGLRAQFQTLYYGGGDDTTRKVMVGYRTPEPPGRGLVYLRSAVTPEPQLVRVPLVTNADVEALLGAAPASAPASQVIDGQAWRVPDATSPPEAGGSGPEAAEVAPELSEKAQKVRELVRAGVSSRQIIQQVWGVSGGNGYTVASAELTGILAQLVA